MQQVRIIEILSDEKDDLYGISINGNCYHISYILDYNIDIDCLDETIIGCFVVDNGCVIEYEFTLNDLFNAQELKFYELKEIS